MTVAAAAKTVAFERGDHLYLVSPVAPFAPSETEIEEFAFAEVIRSQAPNPNIMWMRGQYVVADRANLNNALWTSSELAIKSLTPNFMPVTVMHDPRTAVGLIADTRLITEGDDEAARLDNTIGIWKHRFPEVAEEAMSNYERGELMQSMECLPSHYDCSTCGMTFPKLPGGAERANWCPHLRGEEAAKAARILRNVCFTGTGLIFGSRGAKGALESGHLEVFQDEVAEFHERVHRDKPNRAKRSSRHMEIDDSRYQELVAAEAKAKELEGKLSDAQETAAKVPDLERKVETTETAKVAAEKERDDLKAKVDEGEEKARVETLAKDRLAKLGGKFTESLGEFTRGRLEEQAGKLSDEEWDARLQELEETADVKRDAKKDGEEEDKGGGAGGKNDDTFTREETARSRAGAGGGNGGNGGEATPAKRASVVEGLVRRSQPKPKASTGS